MIIGKIIATKPKKTHQKKPQNIHIVLLCFCEILEGAGEVAEDSGWGGGDGFVTVTHCTLKRMNFVMSETRIIWK